MKEKVIVIKIKGKIMIKIIKCSKCSSAQLTEIKLPFYLIKKNEKCFKCLECGHIFVL